MHLWFCVLYETFINLFAASQGFGGTFLSAQRARSLLMDSSNIPSNPSPLVTPTRSAADLPNQVSVQKLHH
jgi:hypothetical protein